MSQTSDDLRATVKERCAKAAYSLGQEKKFPVGPTSAKKPGYDLNEIDGLPTSLPESFCGVRMIRES